MAPGAIAAALQLVNLAAPGIITLITTIRNGGKSTSTTSIFVTLDQADAQFAANLAELNSELAKLKK